MGFFNFFKRDISEEEFQEQQKVKRGLEKTRTGFFQRIVNTLTNAQIDDDLYDQLEEQLILADVGPACAVRLVDELHDEVEEKHLKTGQEALDALRGIICQELTPRYPMELDGKPARIRVQCAEFPAAEAGERFTARFTLRTLKNDRYRLAKQSDGVYLRAEYAGSYSPLPASRHPVFWLYRLRQRGSTALKRWMPADSAALISAMLLGDTTRLSDADRDAFAAAVCASVIRISIHALRGEGDR